jgi:hypothetical protein
MARKPTRTEFLSQRDGVGIYRVRVAIIGGYRIFDVRKEAEDSWAIYPENNAAWRLLSCPKRVLTYRTKRECLDVLQAFVGHDAH